MADAVWRSNYIKALEKANEYQRTIIDRGSQVGEPQVPLAGGANWQIPIRTIAAAGSGKSTTIVALVANILANDLLSPNEIIVTTFTAKAGEELKNKLMAVVEPRKNAVLNGAAGVKRVGTFHSMAIGWLSRHDPQMPPHRWSSGNVDSPSVRSRIDDPDAPDPKLAPGPTGRRDANVAEARHAIESMLQRLSAPDDGTVSELPGHALLARLKGNDLEQFLKWTLLDVVLSAKPSPRSKKRYGEFWLLSPSNERPNRLMELPAKIREWARSTRDVAGLDEARTRLEAALEVGESIINKVPSADSIFTQILGDYGNVHGTGIRGLNMDEWYVNNGKGEEPPSPRDYKGMIGVFRGYDAAPNNKLGQALARLADEGKEIQGDDLPHIDVPRDLPRILEVWRMYEEVKKKLNGWDYADAIEAYWKRGTDRAKLVIVDEGQDNQYVQLMLAKSMAERAGGRLCLIGDVRQCIPDGQEVHTPDGWVKIENLRVGDKVYASMEAKAVPCLVNAKTRIKKQAAYEYTTETGTTFQATKEHILFAALGEPPDVGGTYVYLMYREDYGFRVGVTGFGKDRGACSISIRSQQEGASRMWLVAYFPGGQQARRLEHHISYTYGIPQDPFKLRGSSPFESDADARSFFQQFEGNGYRALKDLGLDFDHPSHVAKNTRRGGVAVNHRLGTRIGVRCAGGSVIQVESATISDDIADRYGFQPGRRGCRKLARYFSDAGEAFRFSASLARDCDGHVVESLSLPGSGRRVFGVSASGVHPGMLVPEEIDGIVTLKKVVSRREIPVQWCNDIEVDSAANFIVRGSGPNGVVVHNSIFAWNGAAPEVFADAPQYLGSEVVDLPIPTNYRSGKRIVDVGNEVSYGQDWSVGPEAIAARRDKDGTRPEGVVEIRRGDDDESDEAISTAEDIAKRIAAGAQPRDFAILVRTNRQTGLYEMALLQQQVQVVVLGAKSNFFARYEVKQVIAICMLSNQMAKPTGRIADLLKNAAWGLDDPVKAFLLVHRLGDAKLFNRLGVKNLEAMLAPAYAEQDPSLPHTRRLSNALAWVRDEGEYQRKDGSRSTAEAWAQDFNRWISILGKLSARLSWPETVDFALNLLHPPKRDGDDEEDVETEDDAGALARSFAPIAIKFENMTALLNFACDMQERVVAVSNLGNLTGEAREKAEDAIAKSVTVSTVHKSKGLGFKNVYVSASSRQFPSFRASLSELRYAEERRLFYVAVTRTEDRCVLTCYEKKDTARGPKPVGPSEFVTEIVAPYLLRRERGIPAWLDVQEAAIQAQAPGWSLVTDRSDLFEDGEHGILNWRATDGSMVGLVEDRRSGADNQAIPSTWTLTWQGAVVAEDIASIDEAIRQAGAVMQSPRSPTPEPEPPSLPEPPRTRTPKPRTPVQPEPPAPKARTPKERTPAPAAPEVSDFDAFIAFVAALPGSPRPGLTWAQYAVWLDANRATVLPDFEAIAASRDIVRRAMGWSSLEDLWRIAEQNAGVKCSEGTEGYAVYRKTFLGLLWRLPDGRLAYRGSLGLERPSGCLPDGSDCVRFTRACITEGDATDPRLILAFWPDRKAGYKIPASLPIYVDGSVDFIAAIEERTRSLGVDVDPCEDPPCNLPMPAEAPPGVQREPEASAPSSSSAERPVVWVQIPPGVYVTKSLSASVIVGVDPQGNFEWVTVARGYKSKPPVKSLLRVGSIVMYDDEESAAHTKFTLARVGDDGLLVTIGSWLSTGLSAEAGREARAQVARQLLTLWSQDPVSHVEPALRPFVRRLYEAGVEQVLRIQDTRLLAVGTDLVGDMPRDRLLASVDYRDGETILPREWNALLDAGKLVRVEGGVRLVL